MKDGDGGPESLGSSMSPDATMSMDILLLDLQLCEMCPYWEGSFWLQWHEGFGLK